MDLCEFQTSLDYTQKQGKTKTKLKTTLSLLRAFFMSALGEACFQKACHTLEWLYLNPHICLSFMVPRI